MKKYFVKTTVVLLISAIVPMVSGLCFNVLSNSFFQIKTAQAASLDIRLVTDGDMCSQEPVSGQASTLTPTLSSILSSAPTLTSTPTLVLTSTQAGSTTGSHSSSLLCCLTGNNASTVTVPQSAEIGKSLPLIFFNQKILPEDILRVTVHRALLTSPPELSSIQTTILRI